MATISFIVKPLKNGNMDIFAILRDGNNKPAYKDTGYLIPATKVNGKYKYWDKKSRRARGVPNADKINSLLSSWETRFNNYKSHCKEKNKKLDIHAFKKSLETGSTATVADTNDLKGMIEKYIAANRSQLKVLGIRPYEVLTNQVETYYSLYGIVNLQNIDSEFYKNYAQYLLDYHNNTNNSILRKISRISTIMTFAYEHGYIDKIPPKGKLKWKPTPARKTSLLPDELNKLHKLKLKDAYETMVLDAFLFATETGCRHSDILQIAPAHFKKQNDINILDLTQFKGTVENTIPLTNVALKIAKKYLTKNLTTPLFQFDYSQSTSRVLKRIFKEAKLDRFCEFLEGNGAEIKKEFVPLHEVISFHMARNTYISRLLAMGLPEVYVQENVGHKDPRTTRSYSRQNDTLRWKATLELLNKKSRK